MKCGTRIRHYKPDPSELGQSLGGFLGGCPNPKKVVQNSGLPDGVRFTFECNPASSSPNALPVHSWFALLAPSCSCAACDASPPRATLMTHEIQPAAAHHRAACSVPPRVTLGSAGRGHAPPMPDVSRGMFVESPPRGVHRVSAEELKNLADSNSARPGHSEAAVRTAER